MFLTIDQAAAKLGQSARQVRYKISNNLIKAQKLGNVWIIDENDLPEGTEKQEAVSDKRQERFEKDVDKALQATEVKNEGVYSVQSLRVFKALFEVCKKVRLHFGSEHEACVSLNQSLKQLTVGFHRFGRADKSLAYNQARDLSAQAVCILMLTDDDKALSFCRELEGPVLTAFAGLLKRNEEKRR